jgi:hypothetical protein
MMIRPSHPFPTSTSTADRGGDHTSGTLVPRRCTLAGFATEVAQAEGLDIREVEPLTIILVRTQNSVYRLIPLHRGDSCVLVDGGQFFPEPTEAHLAGSTFGGSFLKLAWIGVGMHLELHAGGQCIITSPVRRITTERNRSSTAATQ